MTTYKPDERYMTLPEVVDYTKVSERTLREWIQKKGLKAYKPGKQLLFLKSEIDRFIKSKAA